MKNGYESDTSVYIDEKIPHVARTVIKKQVTDEAFFICDVRNLKYKVDLWRQELPRVTPFFAVKCSTDPVVLRTLNSQGVNFDCSNKGEIKMVFDMGVTPDRIVYANTVKCTSHLRFAEKHGVTLMTFDSAEELHKIKDKNARLLLRIAASEYGSHQTMNAKYGSHPHEVENLMKLALYKGFNIVGVSFHVGCSFTHPEIFAQTIEEAKAVFDMGARFGFSMTLLDIGGGFPGGVRKLERFKQVVCQTIKSALDEHFPLSSGVEIIGEPGQFFVTSAFTLATKVIAKRRKDLTIDGVVHRHENVFINESKYNCIPRDLYPFMDIRYKPLTPPFDRPYDVLTTLWAATCNPMDCILDKQLFFEVDVDEWMLMDNMGAYTLVLSSGFNGFGFPPVKYITSADDAPAVKKTVDSMTVRSGYGHLEQVVKVRHSRSVSHC
ncbi:unnamed protein product [Ixodes hexagonus]